MYTSKNFILILIVLGIIAMVGGLAWIGLQSKNNLKSPAIFEFMGMIPVPVSPNVKPVVYTSITYNFAGSITSLTPSATGTDLVLELMPKGLNKFDICKICQTPTSVYTRKDNKFIQTDPKNLKVGQQVIVIASYAIQQKTWNTFRVNIYPLTK